MTIGKAEAYTPEGLAALKIGNLNYVQLLGLRLPIKNNRNNIT